MHRANPSRPPSGQPSHAIWPEPVDNLHIANFPEKVTKPTRRFHNSRFVDLVEIPFIREHGVERPALIGHALSNSAIEVICEGRNQEADHCHNKRRPEHPGIAVIMLNLVNRMHNIRGRRSIDRACPESRSVEHGVIEKPTGEHRS